MYEEYFGLKRPPFRITPDTSLFYDGGQRGDILGALVYAIHRGEGIVKVVGEVGSGKTMLRLGGTWREYDLGMRPLQLGLRVLSMHQHQLLMGIFALRH